MPILDLFKRSENRKSSTGQDKDPEWGTLLAVSEDSHTIDENGNVAVNVDSSSVQKVLRERFDELEKFDRAMISHHA